MYPHTQRSLGCSFAIFNIIFFSFLTISYGLFIDARSRAGRLVPFLNNTPHARDGTHTERGKKNAIYTHRTTPARVFLLLFCCLCAALFPDSSVGLVPFSLAVYNSYMRTHSAPFSTHAVLAFLHTYDNNYRFILFVRTSIIYTVRVGNGKRTCGPPTLTHILAIRLRNFTHHTTPHT